MNFGTFVYDNKIYNLEYMKKEEVEKILNSIEVEKKNYFSQMKETSSNTRRKIGGYNIGK